MTQIRTLEQLLELEQRQLNRKSRLEGLTNANNSGHSATRQEIAKLLAAGERTGDPIRDYLLATGYGSDEVAYQRLNTLDESLRGKTGELIAGFSYEYTRTYGPEDGAEYQRRLMLAVLRDDKLRITLGDESTCSLPIDSYALFRNPKDARSVEIEKRPLSEDIILRFERLSASGSDKEHASGNTRLAIVAGTDAVRKLFTYTYLTMFEDHKARIKKIEQDIGFLELEAQPAE